MPFFGQCKDLRFAEGGGVIGLALLYFYTASLLAPNSHSLFALLAADNLLFSKVYYVMVGLYLPAAAVEKMAVQGGRIVEVGPGTPIPSPTEFNDEPWKQGEAARPQYVPMEANVGDFALFLRNAAVEIEFEGTKYLIVPHAAILLLARSEGFGDWSPESARRLSEVQRVVLGYRARDLDGAGDVAEAVAYLLDHARMGDIGALASSPSTVHTSTWRKPASVSSFSRTAGSPRLNGPG